MKINFWITALAIAAFSNFATAQENPAAKGTTATDKNIKRPAFADSNKDGICDNFVANQGRGNCKGTGRGQGQRNGNGYCGGSGKGNGSGRGYGACRNK